MGESSCKICDDDDVDEEEEGNDTGEEEVNHIDGFRSFKPQSFVTSHQNE